MRPASIVLPSPTSSATSHRVGQDSRTRFANPELVWQQGDAGSREDPPSIVDRTDALAEDSRYYFQRGVEIPPTHPLGQTLDEFEVGGKTFFYPMLETDNDALALTQDDFA